MDRASVIEVEYRFPGHLRDRIDALYQDRGLAFTGHYSIIDHYFAFDSASGNQYRLRKAVEHTAPLPTLQYYEMCKEPLDGFLQETSRPLDFDTYHELITKKGDPLFSVKGERMQFSYQRINICLDSLDALGEWTELEVLVDLERDIRDAETEIFNFVRTIETYDGEILQHLTKETYPSLLLNHHEAHHTC